MKKKMSNLIIIVLNGLGGLLLGRFFYMGLYWTVKKGLTSNHPGLLVSSSFLIRTAILLAGVLLLTKGVLIALVACGAGIVLSRFIVLIIDKSFLKPKQLNP